MKLFKESISTPWIEIYDKTGTKHRQWPSMAWPPKHNRMRLQEGAQKKRPSMHIGRTKSDGGDTYPKNQYQRITIDLLCDSNPTLKRYFVADAQSSSAVCNKPKINDEVVIWQLKKTVTRHPSSSKRGAPRPP